jgi:ethanolamine ammonia-lyase large subunit
MKGSASVGGERFAFGALAEILARANEPKSGGVLAGIAGGPAAAGCRH